MPEPTTRPPLDIAAARNMLARARPYAVDGFPARSPDEPLRGQRSAYNAIVHVMPAALDELEQRRGQVDRVRAVLADWSGPRRHMSASHPLAELLDRLTEAVSEPAQTKGEEPR